eukprot:TRINITY_DN14018_c0_g1_i1.p1 TRINITY_DN14018_c0_g1~~TRINITY_DN14018_c0_g1_i1.p1  ORF type:complete len:455 (-),score=44.30 TRINITY_DN14018_c0_g1_i1:49-1413(-)
MCIRDSIYVAGKRPRDSSLPIDDRRTLLGPYKGYRLVKILVWYDRCVAGLQLFYRVPGEVEEITSGPQVSSNVSKCMSGVFQLGADEYITEIFGGVGDLLDSIGFRTNLNSTTKFGGEGGTPYHFIAAAKECFNNIVFTRNGYLHQVAVFSVPPPQLYGEPTGLADFLASVDLGGGSNGKPPLEDQKSVEAIHKIMMKSLYQFMESTYEGRTLKQGVKKSGGVGHIKDDTWFFDEYHDIIYNFPPTDIYGLVLYYDDDSLFGLEVSYVVGAKVVNGSRYLGSSINNSPFKTKTLVLEPGEHITEVSGRAWNIVYGLRIVTSKGIILEVGSPDKGEPFKNLVPEGSRVYAFGGGLDGHLDYLYVYLVSMITPIQVGFNAYLLQLRLLLLQILFLSDHTLHTSRNYLCVIIYIGCSTSFSLLKIPLLSLQTVSYTHLRAHETRHDLVCRLLLEKKK